MACGRLLACFSVNVIYFLAMKHCEVKGQLNLYITKEHLNNNLRLNFKTDVYLIKKGMPADLLRSPQAFYSLLSPISPSVKDLTFCWYSDPQKEHYSIHFKSSDTKVMAEPTLLIKPAGIVPRYLSDFKVNFACSGIKAGIVDLCFELNYTRINSGVIDSSSMQQLDFCVRRYCNESVEVTLPSKTNKKIHRMSRAVIVGLCAGVTIFLCISIGALILCRYNIKQKKLQMEFDGESESAPEKEDKLKVVNMKNNKQKDEIPSPPNSPPIFSPRKKHPSCPDSGHKPTIVCSPPRKMFPKSRSKHRQRLSSSSSDCCMTALIETDEENELEPTNGNVYRKKDAEEKEPLQPDNSSCNGTTFVGCCSNSSQNLVHSDIQHSCSTLEKNIVLQQLTDRVLKEDRLEFGRVLWKGELGMVWYGRLRGLNKDHPYSKTEVTVKELKGRVSSEARASFAEKAVIMKNFTHPNILSLLGVVLHKSAPSKMVLQYMKNGDLHRYLLSKRPAGSSSVVLPACRLVNFAYQIAKGMDYLVGKKFVHRNLVARSCLVSEDLTVKIAGFVPIKESNSVDYYHMGKKTSLPVKWMALEGLTKRLFSEKSDVWSFGVVLWEILTYSQDPYSEIDDFRIVEHLQSGHRLQEPRHCTLPLYSIMTSCWREDSSQRPTFSKLVNQLGGYEKRLDPSSVYFTLKDETIC